MISETHVFSPTLLNTARVGWSRIFITAQNFDKGLNLPTQLGIPGVIVPGDEAHTDGLPFLTITGATSIGDPDQCAYPDRHEQLPVQRQPHIWSAASIQSTLAPKLSACSTTCTKRSPSTARMQFTGNFTGLGLGRSAAWRSHVGRLPVPAGHARLSPTRSGVLCAGQLQAE